MSVASEASSAKVTIRVDPATFARLRQAAEADRRPVSSLARIFVIDGLEAWADEGDSDQASTGG